MRKRDKATIFKGGLTRYQKTSGEVFAIADDLGRAGMMRIKVGATVGKMRIKWTLPFEIMDQIRWRLSGYQTIESQRDEQVRYYVEATRRGLGEAEGEHSPETMYQSTRSKHYGKAHAFTEALHLIKSSGHREAHSIGRECTGELALLISKETNKQEAAEETRRQIGSMMRKRGSLRAPE